MAQLWIRRSKAASDLEWHYFLWRKLLIQTLTLFLVSVVMESGIRFDVWQQDGSRRQGADDLPVADSTGHQETDPMRLPSFEGFYKSIFVEAARHKKETEMSMSSDNSEPSFSVESIMRGDINMPGPRSSTPDIPRGTNENYSKASDTDVSQSEKVGDFDISKSETQHVGHVIKPEVRDTDFVTLRSELTKQNLTQPIPKEYDMHSYMEAKELVAPPPEPNKKRYSRQMDKPPYTYAAMVITAIETSPEQALPIADVRASLKQMFPFFRGAYTGWKESVRHCLSRSKYFYSEPAPKSNKPNRRVWKVRRNILKLEMFKRTKDGIPSSVYKPYLHEQLGLTPLCDKPTAPWDLPTRKITLPSQRCFKDSPHTVSAQISTSDDFLHACKDAEDAVSYVTPRSQSRDSSNAMNLSKDSLLGKRKNLEEDSDSSAKKLKPSPSTTESQPCPAASTSMMSRHVDSAMSFDQHQTPQYPQSYQIPHQQMFQYHHGPTYYPYGDHSASLYRQPHFDAYYNGNYGDMSAWRAGYNNYWQPAAGLQTAMDLWYYRQCRASMVEEKDFVYDFSWYARPETEAAADDSSLPDLTPGKE